jgi:hypothetical protein
MAELAGVGLNEIKVGSRVLATDGRVGKVTEVLVGTTSEGSYLRIRVGGWFGKDLYVRAEHVRAIAEPDVRLDVSRRQLEAIATVARPRAFVTGSGA